MKFGPRFIGHCLLYTAIVLSLLVHAELRYADFVWDDRIAIIGNKDVHGDTPLSSLWYHDFWGQVLAHHDSHKSYRPMCVLTFRMNYWWSGLNASSYHVINVLLHSMTTATMFWLGNEIMGVFLERKSQKLLRPLASGFAALFFAVHPVHVEAVAGIVSRADIMAALFMQFALISYIKAKASHSNLLFVGSLILVLFSALSKETGAAVFVLLLLIEILPFENDVNNKKNRDYFRKCGILYSTNWTSAIRLICTTCCALSFFLVRLKIHGGHAIRKWRLVENHIAALPLSRLQTWLTIAHTHAKYAEYGLLPEEGMLAYDHGFNSSTTAIISSWQDSRNLRTLMAYSLVVAGMLYTAVTRSRYLFFVAMLTLLPLAPALNIFFWVGTLLAERLLYLPSVGICLGVGFMFALPFAMLFNAPDDAIFGENIKAAACEDTCSDKKYSSCQQRIFHNWTIRYRIACLHTLSLFVAIIVSRMSIHSYRRSFDWLNETAIYKSGFDSEPGSVKAMNNHALTLIHRGGVDNLMEANQILEQSIAMTDSTNHAFSNSNAVYNRGLALSGLSNYSGAVHYFILALKQFPMSQAETRADLHLHVAEGLMNLRTFDKSHNLPRSKDYSGTFASDTFEYLALVEWHSLRALILGCKRSSTNYTLGNVYMETSRFDLAIGTYQTALKVYSNSDVYNMLGLAFQGRFMLCKSKGASSIGESVQLTITEPVSASFDPSNFESAHSIYSVVERVVVKDCADSIANDLSRSINAFQATLKINSNHFQAHVNMGTLYRSTGDLELAKNSYKNALALNPGHSLLMHNLAGVILELGHYREALVFAERAFSLAKHNNEIVKGYQDTLEAVALWLHENGERTTREEDEQFNNPAEIIVEGSLILKPVEALQMYNKIFAVGPADPRILSQMISAFHKIVSSKERMVFTDTLLNVLAAIETMSKEEINTVLKGEGLIALARALQSVGKNGEAKRVSTLLG